MNFNENVNKDFVNQVLESALWAKAKITVNRNVLTENNNEGDIGDIPEYENGVVNEFEEPTDIDIQYAEGEEEDVTFSLDDLQTVLDNLEDEDLMEHAMNMLEVFDVAFETLNEGDDDDEEEDEDEDEESETEAVQERWGGNKGDKSKTRPGEEDFTTKKGMKKKTGKGKAFRK